MFDFAYAYTATTPSVFNRSAEIIPKLLCGRKMKKQCAIVPYVQSISVFQSKEHLYLAVSAAKHPSLIFIGVIRISYR